MDDGNYYTVQGWMVNKLDLSGYELACFAIIYGFSQDGQSPFKGSLDYISSFLKCSTRTVQRNIDNLIEKNFIYLVSKGTTKSNPSVYKANVKYKDGEIIYINPTVDKMSIVKMSDNCRQNVHSTIDKMSTNNNINNYSYNNEKKDINSVPSFISKEKGDKPKRFSGVNPSKEEVEAYIKERNYHISADEVIRYYTDRGRFPVWRLSNGNLVKDWKRCCGTFEDGWKRRNGNNPDISEEKKKLMSEAEKEKAEIRAYMKSLGGINNAAV